jgi:hypothetical protein
MIGIIILAAFLIGWFGGIAAYKYGLKNSPVILPPKNKYDAHRQLWDFQEQEYEARLKEYNRQNAELEKQKEEFYEANPDFPIKTMYMQVIAPPQKVSIREVR